MDDVRFTLRDIFTTVRDAFTAHLSSKTISVKCEDKEVTKQLPLNIFIASNIAHHLVTQGEEKEEDVRAAMAAVGYEELDYLKCASFSTGGKRRTRRASKKRQQ